MHDPLTDLYRRLTPHDKWLLMGHIDSEVRRFHADYVRKRNPQATDQDIADDGMGFSLEPKQYRDVKDFMRKQALQCSADLNSTAPDFTVLARPAGAQDG